MSKKRRKPKPKLDLRNPHDDPNFAKRLAKGSEMLYTDDEQDRELGDSWDKVWRKLDRMGL